MGELDEAAVGVAGEAFEEEGRGVAGDVEEASLGFVGDGGFDGLDGVGDHDPVAEASSW